MSEYTLTLNEEQLQALIKSTQSFSRICTGQIEYALEEGWQDKLIKLPYETREMIEQKCKVITTLLSEGKFDGRGGSYGIYHPDIDKHAAVAFNIHQVLRNQVWKNRKDEGQDPGHGVDSSVTICNGETPIKIEKIG
jgi:hypothetical protein